MNKQLLLLNIDYIVISATSDAILDIEEEDRKHGDFLRLVVFFSFYHTSILFYCRNIIFGLQEQEDRIRLS